MINDHGGSCQILFTGWRRSPVELRFPFQNVTRRYGKPEFGLTETRIHGMTVPVREEIVASTIRRAGAIMECANS